MNRSNLSRLMRGLSNILFAALGLGPLASAQVTLPFGSEVIPERIEVTVSSVAVAFVGFVSEPNGTPADGAVVVSSAGGQVITDANGAFRLTIQVPIAAAEVQITAVGRTGGDLLASQLVRVPGVPGEVQVGPLLLAQTSQCLPSWLPSSGMAPGMNEQVRALAVFDDGSGAALYAGGDFWTAGGALADSIAKWDGSAWAAVGSGLDGTNPTVLSLTVFDDGGGAALYAGGSFSHAGITPVNNIAKWDGSKWEALGDGITAFNPAVLSLTVFDDGGGAALYAGGRFSSAGFGTANNIAKWDGSTWEALGSGLDGANPAVLSLTVFDDGGGAALFAGGRFSSAGIATANNMAKWDGSTWTALGSGIDARVLALAVFDDGGGPALYAGGSFTSAGSVSANNMAKWDGSAWMALGDELDARVHTLTVFDDGSGPALFAGGSFTTAGAVTASKIAKWDGSRWAALGSGMGTNDLVRALSVFDAGGGETLQAGGRLTSAGGLAANHIAEWDGSNWAVAVGAPNDSVSALTVFDDGAGAALYAGGSFTNAGGLATSHIARWDGSSWTPLGSGVDDEVVALAVFDDGGGLALYAAGGFTSAGGVAANNIAKWDGSTWDALGSGTSGPNSSVGALAVFDDGGGPVLHAAGWFTSAGGVAANNIAKWDGSKWAALGGGTGGPNSSVGALAVFDAGGGPALYAGGSFTSAGSVAANNIAKWDGSTWAALGSGMGGSGATVLTMTVFDDGSGKELYAGGSFSSAGGVAVKHIAKWDGSTWQGLGSAGSGLLNLVRDLAVFDDGGGPALYAGGGFSGTGAAAANYIAKWDGSIWGILGSGLTASPSTTVHALTVFDEGGSPALYAGGFFMSAIDSGDSHLARWGCEATGALAIYCTAGTSSSGCNAHISATGVPSATAASGFTLAATQVERKKDGLFFFGANGRQAQAWGNGTSFQCVAPPVQRADLLAGNGLVGLCGGAFVQDFNALWNATPVKNPGAGAVVQVQFWYSDPFNTANQTSSLSDALEFVVGP